MKPQVRDFGSIIRRWGATILVLLAALLCCTVDASMPAQAAEQAGSGARLELQVSEETALAPFLAVVPTSDGDLWVHAQGTGQLEGLVYANTEIGPGHHKGGWTMAYSDTLRGYVNVEPVVGFSPEQDDYASLSITTTLGLDSGSIHLQRYYVPLSTTRTLTSLDGAFEVALPSDDTFTTDIYLALAPSWGLPRPAPLGHRLASKVYGVRASGALLETERPMLVRLYILEEPLDAADPHTLAVFRWDAPENRWTNLGGTLFGAWGYLSAATRRLTSYALMSTPTWRDEFDDATGLSERVNVEWGRPADDLALVLSAAETDGDAVSIPISATAGTTWETLAYRADVAAPTQALTVDLLRPDGTLVRSDVPSGADLSDLRTDDYPALKLRVGLHSDVAGASPALYQWQLTWRAQAHVCYLPVVQTEP